MKTTNLIKTLVLLTISLIFIQCNSEDNSGTNTDTNISSEVLSTLPIELQNEFKSSLEFNDDNELVGFKYADLKSSLDEQTYYTLIAEVLNTDKFVYVTGEKAVSYSITKEQGEVVMQRADSSLEVEDGDIKTFADKRNYRRPGCKPAGGYVCVIR